MGIFDSAPTTWTATTPSVGDFNDEIRDRFRYLGGVATGPHPHAILLGGTTTLTSGSFTPLEFASAERNNGAMWTSGSSITIADGGAYHMNVWVEVESSASNKELRIIKNGTSVIAAHNIYGVGTPAVGRISTCGDAELVAGDVITFRVFHDLGSSVSATPYRASVRWIGAP
jgi:hypothetical protein